MPQSISRKALAVLAIALIAFFVDQATKWAILNVVMRPPREIAMTPFFNLRLGFNPGVSFGMFREQLQEWPHLFTAFKVVVATVFMAWAVATSNPFERAGLSMIAGGAFGNALDRWRQGAVTDFLDFYIGDWHWPTFNMADVAITLGVVAVLLGALISSRQPSGSAAS